MTAVVALAGGCAQSATGIRVISYKDPFFPEPYQVDFDRAVFQATPGGDRHIGAFRIEPEGDVQQWLHLHVFWKPRPGRTYADPSLIDATAQYVVQTARGSAVYQGTAFVDLKPQREGRLRVRIESGLLRLESLNGSPAETIGDARLEGEFVANPDAGATVEIRRLVERHVAGTIVPEASGT